MNTNLKVILTAIGIAVLATPSMASERHLNTVQSISSAHGSVAGTRTAPVIQGNNPFNIDDAVHVAFPQRDGGV
jgi:hypothetical protein